MAADLERHPATRDIHNPADLWICRTQRALRIATENAQRGDVIDWQGKGDPEYWIPATIGMVIRDRNEPPPGYTAAEIEDLKDLALSAMTAQAQEFCVGAEENAAADADYKRVNDFFDWAICQRLDTLRG